MKIYDLEEIAASHGSIANSSNANFRGRHPLAARGYSPFVRGDRPLKIRVPLIVLLCWCGTAMAGQLLAPVNNWAGFLAVADAPLPPSIDKDRIAGSVFNIEFFGGEGGDREVEIVEVDQLIGEEDLCDEGDCASDRELQIKNCVLQKIERCPVFASRKRATSFAIGDTRTLATSLHVFHTWMRTVLEANPRFSYFDLTPPFVLINDDGETFYNSVISANKPRVSFVDMDPEILNTRFPAREDANYLAGEWWRRWNLFLASDYIELAFDRPLFLANLERSPTAQPGEKIYALGYQDIRKFYDQYGIVPTQEYSNPGRFLSISSGDVLKIDKTEIGVTAISSFGSSGGPVVDARGRVVCAISSSHSWHKFFVYSKCVVTNKELF